MIEVDNELIRDGHAEMARLYGEDLKTQNPSILQDNSLEMNIAKASLQAYLGRSVAMKLEILNAVVTGTGNIAEISRHYNVTRQAGHAMAGRARKVLCKTAG